jgi:uncharacterized phage-associated protein
MTVSAFAAAKRLAKRSGWTLTNLEMQKILYLAHMFYLGRTGQPLVSGEFEAWDYGPVHPSLYHRIKIYGSEPVGNVFHNTPDITGAEADILDEAYDSLGKVGASRLVRATHRPGGAWEKHYRMGERNCVMPNADILQEYRDLDSKNNVAKA